MIAVLPTDWRQLLADADDPVELVESWVVPYAGAAEKIAQAMYDKTSPNARVRVCWEDAPRAVRTVYRRKAATALSTLHELGSAATGKVDGR